MMSGPDPLWTAALTLGWRSSALTNSMVTLAPVFIMKSSSICFLKNGSESGTKLAHCSTVSEAPLRFGSDGLPAGAACAAAGLAGAAVGDGAAGWQAASSGSVVAPRVAPSPRRNAERRDRRDERAGPAILLLPAAATGGACRRAAPIAAP